VRGGHASALVSASGVEHAGAATGPGWQQADGNGWRLWWGDITVLGLVGVVVVVVMSVVVVVVVILAFAIAFAFAFILLYRLWQRQPWTRPQVKV